MNIKKFRVKPEVFIRPPIAFSLLLIGIVSVNAQSGQSGQRREEQKLTALVRQMTAAQTGFDASALEKIYASDYVELSPIGEVDAREKAIGFYKPEANANAGKVKTIVPTDEFSVRLYRGFAVVIARFTFAQSGAETPGARPPASFRATIVCRKERKAWKIASVQATAIRPPRLR